MTETPLSTPLSHALVAYTIELDNEFERRFAESGLIRRFGVSLVMWSNFLRFVGDGVSVGELPVTAGLPRNTMLSMLGGMERWGYVFVTPGPTDPPPESKRDGYGSARGLRSDWVVRPTPAGLKALEIWPPVRDDIERRWEERFGTEVVDELRESLAALVGQLDVDLPEYLPIVGSANAMKADVDLRERRNRAVATGDSPIPHLSPLLPQMLLAYTLDLERDSEQGLPLSANFLRVLDDTGIDVRQLPFAAGVSSEAASIALRYLTKTGNVVVEAKVARLTPRGREAQEAARLLHGEVEQRWNARFGADPVGRLRAALHGVLDQRDELSRGLKPHPDGWRASKGYAEQTEAVLADPLERLPQYPMVLHRGGWPDGS